jgi:hypothetical protein
MTRDLKVWRINYDDGSITECARANKPTRFATAEDNLLWEPGKTFTIEKMDKTPDTTFPILVKNKSLDLRG